jgi:hypothetical protein
MAKQAEKLIKLSFGFTGDDYDLLESLKIDLRGTNGVLSNVGVVRIALRALKRNYEPANHISEAHSA